MVPRCRFVMVALAPTLLVGALLVGCSSDAPSSGALTPFDSGSATIPEAGAGPSPITVQVQGQGAVYSADAHDVDGSLEGQLACSPSSTPAQCAAPLRTTLYAIASTGWVFSRWTTTGLADGIDLGGGASSYSVGAWSPSPLIAVFVPAPKGGTTPSAPDAGPAPADAGGQG